MVLQLLTFRARGEDELKVSILFEDKWFCNVNLFGDTHSHLTFQSSSRISGFATLYSQSKWTVKRVSILFEDKWFCNP